jgi:hypothetical protein
MAKDKEAKKPEPKKPEEGAIEQTLGNVYNVVEGSVDNVLDAADATAKALQEGGAATGTDALKTVISLATTGIGTAVKGVGIVTQFFGKEYDIGKKVVGSFFSSESPSASTGGAGRSSDAEVLEADDKIEPTAQQVESPAAHLGVGLAGTRGITTDYPIEREEYTPGTGDRIEQKPVNRPQVQPSGHLATVDDAVEQEQSAAHEKRKQKQENVVDDDASVPDARYGNQSADNVEAHTEVAASAVGALGRLMDGVGKRLGHPTSEEKPVAQTDGLATAIEKAGKEETPTMGIPLASIDKERGGGRG